MDLTGFRKCFAVTLPVLLLGLAGSAFAKDFTQADLEKIVAELGKVIPENPDYKYPIKCTIVDKNEVNAYATLTKEGADKRSTMVVFTGLVKQIGGDERLIRAVVAHELSHLSLGHLSTPNYSGRDLMNLWTRQQEFAADKSGAEALVKAGHPKKDMVDMLLFLDRIRERDGGWLDRLTADHADPKARAAEVSDNPAALNALITYDMALAYEDAREHRFAQKLFDFAGTQWPALTEAYINSGKCALLYYYDNLPKAVRAAWWRPDFGPLITNPHAPAPQAVEITDEDRQAWKDAMEEITKAKERNAGSTDAEELLALAQVLEPDAKKDVVQLGIDWFKSNGSSATDPIVKLRYANNAGVGYQRTGDLQSAYTTIMTAQKETKKFNAALGENLGLVVVKGRSKDDDELAMNVLFTWLGNTPSTSPRWSTVKKTFDEICTKTGLQAKEIKQRPGLLCQVTTLVTSKKRFGLLLPVSGAKQLLGDPDKVITFTSQYPDMTELRWHDENLTVLTERDRVLRITTYEPDGYLLLKSADTTSTDEIKIQVGMTKADLFAILNEDAAVMKNLAKGPKVEQWHYFPDLGMGVLLEGDKVKALTVTPVLYEG